MNTNRNVRNGKMDDKRCCGSGACIINAQGVCWCGQKWNGDKLMSSQPSPSKPPIVETKPTKKNK